MGCKDNMLVQDVSTRWNSTYAMLSRLHEQRWPVTATLSDPAVTQRGKHYLDLKPEQWNLIEELNQVLEPFESATVFLSGQHYVTLSALPHLVHKLKKNIQSPELETAPVSSFQTHATEQVTERWQGLLEFTPESPNITLLAAALDPRFRKLRFLAAEEVVKVQSAVRAMALAAKQQVRQPTASKHGADSTAQDSPPAAHAKTTTSFLDSDSTTSDEEQDEEQQLLQAVHQEVYMYFGEHPLSKKENPLTWWEKNAARYPTLAELARSLLCIPATSTPSERLFSAAGNIVSKKRASLSPEHVDMLTFLHCNKVLL
ncbi:E3 SUMO-protein ligase ZBED1-like [Epinephelus fuscoguttatus]|uniref:E3 SUMO-protein ligase ZBED1-like n=1 Tax=Epinephelus fuscoguttatus TaxID=293821 RepID=UPI0020D023AB|nr:E3 SUMO-protein ligase ZBED1-like [Epinephelus fuscoguttatus]